MIEINIAELGASPIINARTNNPTTCPPTRIARRTGSEIPLVSAKSSFGTIKDFQYWKHEGFVAWNAHISFGIENGKRILILTQSVFYSAATNNGPLKKEIPNNPPISGDGMAWVNAVW